MVKPPCERDCPRRTVGCHAKCAPYLEYEEAKQAEALTSCNVEIQFAVRPRAGAMWRNCENEKTAL